MLMWKFLRPRTWLGLGVSVFLSACGGGEAPGQGPAGGNGQPTAQSLQITTAKTSIASGDTAGLDVTVTAIDSANRTVSGVKVNVSVDSGVLAIPVDAVTDANGKVTGKLLVGADRANRVITIQAKAGNVTKSTTVTVDGSKLVLSSSASAVTSANESLTLTAKAEDSSLQAIAGVLVSFATNQGTLSSATAITNAQGLASVQLTGVTSAAQVGASGAGATSDQVVIYAGSTALPEVVPSDAVVSNFFVQVNPAVIGPNLPGSSAQYSDVLVTVLGDGAGAVGIPIKNARVKMRVLEPTQGTLATATTNASPALTNAAGEARNRFIAGPSATGADKVVICAEVIGVSLPSDGSGCALNERGAKMTIAQQPLFVKITDNDKIELVDNDLYYQARFGVLVLDAVGRGIPGAVVDFRFLPLSYETGRYVTGQGGWVRASPVFECPNEDLNFNGTRDPGEPDHNRDNALDPGQVAAFSLSNGGKTDATGVVQVTVKYGARFATWFNYEAQARALVGGTEGSTAMLFIPGAPSSAFTNVNVTPAFRDSPFGIFGTNPSPGACTQLP